MKNKDALAKVAEQSGVPLDACERVVKALEKVTVYFSNPIKTPGAHMRREFLHWGYGWNYSRLAWLVMMVSRL